LVACRRAAMLPALLLWGVGGAARGAPHPRLVVNAPEAVAVFADLPRLEQAVRRLVDNAIRYSPPGDVEIDVAPSDKYVVISVRDRGIGIPADQKSRMFELVFRAHAGTPPDVGGLGIRRFAGGEMTIRRRGAMVS